MFEIQLIFLIGTFPVFLFIIIAWIIRGIKTYIDIIVIVLVGYIGSGIGFIISSIIFTFVLLFINYKFYIDIFFATIFSVFLNYLFFMISKK